MYKYQLCLAVQEEQEDWRDLARQAREQIQADLGERDLTPPEDVLRELREERKGEINDYAVQPLRTFKFMGVTIGG
jgi:hypothetical protein